MELCQKIKYAYLFEVDSISGNSIVLKNGFDFKTLKLNDIAPADEKSSIEKSGKLVKQTITATFNDADNTTITLSALSEYPIIAYVYFDDSTKIWGSIERPVRCIAINAVEGSNKIELQRLTTVFEWQ